MKVLLFVVVLSLAVLHVSSTSREKRFLFDVSSRLFSWHPLKEALAAKVHRGHQNQSYQHRHYANPPPPPPPPPPPCTVIIIIVIITATAGTLSMSSLSLLASFKCH